MPATADFEQERMELNALLASGIFGRAPSLAQLLTYICTKYFEGEADQIKEYNIAVEALGRSSDFDQKRDSIVRVEAHRLRKRLKEYYERHGAAHNVQIVVPSGQYAPRFVHHDPKTLSLAPVVAPLEPAPSRAIQTVEHPTAEFTTVLPALPRFTRPGWSLFALASGLLSLLAVAILGVRLFSKTERTPLIPADPAALSTSDAVRILAGTESSYVDRFGHLWQSDRLFKGGATFSAANRAIAASRDPQLFQSRREGAFAYDIPLKPGDYELRLYFAETLYGEGNISGGGEASRLFNVRANGATLLDGIDIIADVGPNSADVRVFKGIRPAPDGRLHLTFEPVISVPFVNALEITPGMPGLLTPIRIIAREHGYTDRLGRFWEADRFFRGGNTVLRGDPVSGADDPEIYRGERFGNITYAIPVAKGRYAVTLRFSETWFGPSKPSRGGAGDRLFDILCNGVALARNVDIYKESGGSDRALNKTFHGLEPTPQGKLVITLLPVRNYACINGIEVVDESK